MFGCNIAQSTKYDYLAERFMIGYTFLRETDLERLPEGTVDLEQGVRAQVQIYSTVAGECQKFEAHERYFDIQYVVSGQEYIGLIGRAELEPDCAYDPQNDILFFREPAEAGRILLKSGDFVVVAPEDAHKPRCVAGSVCQVRKIVIKVPV